MRIRIAALAALAGLVVAAAACANLEPMAHDVCGNAVIERDAGEDCDTHVFEAGVRCAEAGEAHACRYVCGAESVCPTGWGCGNDGVCRESTGRFEVFGELVPFP